MYPPSILLLQMISTGFARPLFFDVANSLLIFPFHLAKHIKRSLSYPSAGQFKFLFNPGILFPFFQKAGSFYAAWRINPIISFLSLSHPTASVCLISKRKLHFVPLLQRYITSKPPYCRRFFYRNTIESAFHPASFHCFLIPHRSHIGKAVDGTTCIADKIGQDIATFIP